MASIGVSLAADAFRYLRLGQYLKTNATPTGSMRLQATNANIDDISKMRLGKTLLFSAVLVTLFRCLRRDAKVVVMTLPSVVSDNLTLEELHKANVVFPYYSSAYGVCDFVDLIAAYNRSIRSLTASENVTLIDLAKEMDRRPDHRRLFSDTMHPTHIAVELIADILASRVGEE